MIAKLVRTLLGAAIEGIQRFPITALSLVITAIIANLDIADWIELSGREKQQMYSALAAFSVASLVKQIGIASRGYSMVLQHGGALLAGCVTAALVWFAKDVGLSELAFFAGLGGALLVSAHWFRGTSAGLWFFIVRLLFAAGLAFIAVMVFALGLSAIFASLDYLFGIDVPSEIYGHIWATSLIAAGPLFALGRIPEDFDAEPIIDGDNYGIAGLRLLSDYLAAPMLAIYALILHAYAAKIIITSEVPQNQIGWMVIGYGTLIIFFWKVMLPLRGVLTLSGRAFQRIWPLLVIVPMGLLFYALWLRISEYGVTPDRYFLGAFGLLMTIFALMQAIPFLRNWLPGAAPLTVIALVLGGFGPWGAEMVSVKSQVNHFAKLLDDKSQVIMGEGRRATSILYFLRKHDGLVGLQALAKGLKDDPFGEEPVMEKYKLQARLAIMFGVEAARKNNNGVKNYRNFHFKSGVVSVKGFDRHFSKLSLHSASSKSRQTKLGQGLTIRVEMRAIVIIQGETETSFSLEPLLEFAKDQIENAEATGIELSADGKKIMLVPQYLNVKIGASLELTGGSSELFLRSSDWQ